MWADREECSPTSCNRPQISGGETKAWHGGRSLMLELQVVVFAVDN